MEISGTPRLWGACGMAEAAVLAVGQGGISPA